VPTTIHEEATLRVHEVRADEDEIVDFSLEGLLIAALAGILGVMAFLYAAPALALPRIDVIGLAGTLFTADRYGVIVIGTLLWVGLGMLWAVFYIGLWNRGFGRAGPRSGLLFGLIQGNIVMALYPLLLAFHPAGRQFPLGIDAAICIVLAHLVFGGVIGLVYRQYLPEPV
jgi:hypothetical protein